jgi:hypothetical protein
VPAMALLSLMVSRLASVLDLGLARRWVVVLFHARLEVLNALGEITHDARQLTGAEQNQDDRQDHEPVRQTETSQRFALVPEDVASPIALSAAVHQLSLALPFSLVGSLWFLLGRRYSVEPEPYAPTQSA